jgi:hypothetical protein
MSTARTHDPPPRAAQPSKESEPGSMSQLTYPGAVTPAPPRPVTGPFPLSSPGSEVLSPARARGLASPSRTEPGRAVSLAAVRRADTRAASQGGTLGHILARAGTGARDLPIVAKERA